MRRPTAALAFLVASTSACFATKNDVRLLQDELRATRAQEAHADSARQMQLDSVAETLRRAMAANQTQNTQFFAQTDRNQRTLSDSLTALSTRFGVFKANVNDQLDQLAQGLLHVMESTRAASSQMTTLAASFAADSAGHAQERAASAASAVPGDTSRARVPASDVPPAANLWLGAQDKVNQGAYGAAQDLFGALVDNYPSDPKAGQALLGVGEMYDNLKSPAEADSVYQLVVKKYAKTNEAATALFKRAKYACSKGNKQQASAFLKQIIADGPGWSDVHENAQKLLQTGPCG